MKNKAKYAFEPRLFGPYKCQQLVMERMLHYIIHIQLPMAKLYLYKRVIGLLKKIIHKNKNPIKVAGSQRMIDFISDDTVNKSFGTCIDYLILKEKKYIQARQDNRIRKLTNKFRKVHYIIYLCFFFGTN